MADRAESPLDPAAYEGVATSSVRVAIGTVASRATGVGRVIAVAAVLGPTLLGNLFQAVYVLPALIYQFLAGSLLVALLVPPLVPFAQRGDARAAGRLAGGFLTVIGLVLLAVGVLVVVAAPLLMQGFVSGVEDPALAAEQRSAGILLLTLMVPQVLLFGVAGTASAVLNAHGRFVLPAAAPALENLGVIAVMVLTAAQYGTGLEVTQVGGDQVLVLGLGCTAAVALHAGSLWVAAARLGVPLLPHAGWRDPEVKQVLRRAVPSLGVAGLDAARQFAVLPVANRVPGGVIALQVAMNFTNLPVALIAKPVGTALLPRLAHLFNSGQERLQREELVRGTALTLFLMLPVTVVFLILAEPLSRSIAVGEMAAPVAISQVAVCLAALAPGMLGDGSFYIGTQASYAVRDARTPLVSMAVRAGLTLSGAAVAFFAVQDEIATLVILALALSVGNVIGAWHLARRLAARSPVKGPSFARPLLRASTGAVAMAVPLLLIGHLALGADESRTSALASVLVAGAVGLGAFVLSQRLLRAPELDSIVRGVRRIRARGA